MKRKTVAGEDGWSEMASLMVVISGTLLMFPVLVNAQDFQEIWEFPVKSTRALAAGEIGRAIMLKNASRKNQKN